MYNRYIRNDNGTYTRMPEEEPQAPPPRPDPPPSGGVSPPPHQEPPHSGPNRPPSGRPADGLSGVLRHILDQLHLEHVDTGDLLLLALLFFLSREKADEELLVALGLLLIL